MSKRSRASRRSRILKATLLAAVIGLVLFTVSTIRLFVMPDRGMPANVGAIVMLNGPGDRLDTALQLAWQHRAPFVVISRGSAAYGHGSDCAPQVPHEKIICFDPNPSTTRGEAEFLGRLARQYHWSSVTLITSTAQDSRARLRVGRCFPGPVYVVTVPVSLSSWPYQVAYQWGATIKAVIFQRAC